MSSLCLFPEAVDGINKNVMNGRDTQVQSLVETLLVYSLHSHKRVKSVTKKARLKGLLLLQLG